MRPSARVHIRLPRPHRTKKEEARTALSLIASCTIPVALPPSAVSIVVTVRRQWGETTTATCPPLRETTMGATVDALPRQASPPPPFKRKRERDQRRRWSLPPPAQSPSPSLFPPTATSQPYDDGSERQRQQCAPRCKRQRWVRPSTRFRVRLPCPRHPKKRERQQRLCWSLPHPTRSPSPSPLPPPTSSQPYDNDGEIQRQRRAPPRKRRGWVRPSTRYRIRLPHPRRPKKKGVRAASSSVASSSCPIPVAHPPSAVHVVATVRLQRGETTTATCPPSQETTIGMVRPSMRFRVLPRAPLLLPYSTGA